MMKNYKRVKKTTKKTLKIIKECATQFDILHALKKPENIPVAYLKYFSLIKMDHPKVSILKYIEKDITPQELAKWDIKVVRTPRTFKLFAICNWRNISLDEFSVSSF